MKRLLRGLLVALWSVGAPAQTVAPIVSSVAVVWDSNTTVANAVIPLLLPQWAGGGRIVSCSYYTGGTSTPSFTANVQIGVTSVTGCGAVSVSSSTPATTAATANNTFTASSSITLTITSVAGAPTQALFQVNLATTQN